jgi:hypothetical protein
MKTAISIPDAVFEAAERVAKRLAISRSQLYTAAISEFIKSREQDDVTKRLNEVYAKEPSSIPPELVQAQIRSLGDSTW